LNLSTSADLPETFDINRRRRLVGSERAFNACPNCALHSWQLRLCSLRILVAFSSSFADFSPKHLAPRKFGPVSNGFGAALLSRPTNTLQNHKNQNWSHGKRMLRIPRIAGTFTPLLLAVSVCCLNCNLSERRESQRRKEISHE
jgi:hypothetical protein